MAHIIFFHHEHPILSGGGAEWVVLHRARQCASAGHRVSIISCGMREGPQSGEIELFSVGKNLDLEKGRQIVRSLSPDFLISVTRGDVLEACNRGGRNWKSCIWFHEISLQRTFSDANQINLHADRLIYISQAQRSYFEARGLNPTKGQVVYNGYNQEVFKHQPVPRQNYRIIYAGALVQEKGIDLLFKAFRLVRAKIPAATLEVFGNEEIWDRPHLYSKQRHSHVSEGIFLNGLVPQSRLSREFSRATVCVLPTLRSEISEALGMTPIEAQACGCAVVVSSSGGLVETLDDGKSGFIVTPETPEDLADAIIRILENPALRKQFSLHAQNLAKSRFNPDLLFLRFCRELGLDSPLTTSVLDNALVVPLHQDKIATEIRSDLGSHRG